jgi:hypothetical protein
VAKTLQLPILAGGRLITQPSLGLETVQAQDFTRLLNVFKDADVMARIPGWSKFQPDTGVSVTNQYTFDATESVLRTAELVRGDGTRVVVGASLTKIKFYDTATDAWVQIGSGFSSIGVPWQIITQSGYALFNNAENLPVWWQIGDASVTPLHELRESGIAKAGRMATYNGFVFFGDITEIKADILPVWMNGPQNYGVGSTSAQVANFAITSGQHRVKFDVTTGAGAIVATLPAMTLVNYPFYVLIKKVDGGAGTVTTSPVIDADPVVLDSINDTAIVVWNGQRWAAWTFASGTMPATDPYGIVSEEITEHISDEVAWSELGQPINWAPLVSTVMAAASATIYIPFKPFNWKARETRVAVVNGGPDNGTLGGQTAYPDGVQIVTVGSFSDVNFGVPITLETTTDVEITYPRKVDVTRWADVSTFVGKQRMGNGDRIVTMMELNGVLVIYQTGAIFINRWTAQAAAPFALRSKYVGNAVPMFGDAIVAVRNSYHLYPSREGSFVQFDALTDPIVHELCELARDLFFVGLLPTDRCWAVDNPTLQMAFFVNASRTMAYRYRRDTPGVSEIDFVPGAAAFVRQPGGVNDWFILGIGRFVYTWGLVNGTVTTFLRDGVVPAIPARITSGLNSFRNLMVEKTLISFTPILSSPSPDVELEIQLRSNWNPSAPLTDLLVPVESLPSPMGLNFVPCFFQGNYFQDEITLVDPADEDFRLSARLFEFDVLQGAVPVTRSGNV